MRHFILYLADGCGVNCLLNSFEHRFVLFEDIYRLIIWWHWSTRGCYTIGYTCLRNLAICHGCGCWQSSRILYVISILFFTSSPVIVNLSDFVASLLSTRQHVFDLISIDHETFPQSLFSHFLWTGHVSFLRQLFSWWKVVLKVALVVFNKSAW